MTPIAINVLLEPDATTVALAKALNARLLATYPEGFALDALHVPHITILQRYVPLAELEAVAQAVRQVVAQELPVNWESLATGLYDVAHGDLGAMGMVIQPTKDWCRLQERIIEIGRAHV